MQRITLTATGHAALEHTFNTTPDRRLRDRCQAVLLAGRGRQRQAIAQDLGVHRPTVRLWLKQYRERGSEGLVIHWAPGSPGRIPATLAPTIQSWVQEGPQSCGLDRAHWTYEELATYLDQTQGITVQRTAMRDFCHRHHLRPYRPTSRY
jgi:transposase